MESPCPLTLVLQSSGSSTQTTGAESDFTLSAAFEATNARNPPGNFLKSFRLPELREVETSTRARRTGVTSIIGLNFWSKYFRIVFSFGNRITIGHGSLWIRRPR